MRISSAYVVLLEFPEEKADDPHLAWLKSHRQEVEGFCNEYCVQIGSIILPAPYFPVFDRLLQDVIKDYRLKGYNPLFQVYKARFHENTSLRALILEYVFSRLEKGLKALDEESPSDLQHSQGIRRDLVKVNELVTLYQLDRYFPERMKRCYDLMGVLREKISEKDLPAYDPVVVTEI